MKLAVVVVVAWFAVLPAPVHGGLPSALEEQLRRLPGVRHNMNTGNIAFVNLDRLTETGANIWQFQLKSTAAPLLSGNTLMATGMTVQVDSPYRITWLVDAEVVGRGFDAGDVVPPETPARLLQLVLREVSDDPRGLRLLSPIFAVPEPSAGALGSLGVVAVMAFFRRTAVAR